MRIARFLGAVSSTILLLVQAAPAAAAPNPAAVHCINSGGVRKTYLDQSGNGVTLCRFQDAEFLTGSIGEWTLFHYKFVPEASSLAVNAFVKHVEYRRPSGPVGHPALNYCLQVGGARELLKDPENGNMLGGCRFSDNSLLEEWTLFRGPEYHLRLAAQL